MSKVRKDKLRLLKAVSGSSLDKSKQVVHSCFDKRGQKSVQSLKKQVFKIKMRDRLINPLIEYARAVESPNLPGYLSAYMCSKVLRQSDNRFLKSTHRCGHRLCSICTNIRTAKLLERIMPLMDEGVCWSKMVLTRKNADLGDNTTPEKLRDVISFMQKQFSKIRQKVKRRFGDVDVLMTIECQPNGYKKQRQGGIAYGYYNPHYNLIGPNDVMEFIRAEWLKLVDCDEKNQKLSLIPKDKIKEALLEVIKYSTKGLIDFNKKGGPSYLNVKGVDTIIEAMRGKRRLITWGKFYNKKIEKIEDVSIDELDLQKQSYYDLPIKDTGDLQDLVDSSGLVVCQVPEYVKTIEWGYNPKSFNYEYTDDYGNVHSLLRWKVLPREPDVKVMVDKLPFYLWKQQNVNFYEKMSDL